MSESAVNHEAPESIAARFKDGFMHPNLEHDAERLAKGYLALQARLDAAEADRAKWETSFEKAADALDDAQRQLKRAEAVVKAARETYELECSEPPEYRIEEHADWFDKATEAYQALRERLAAYDAARSGLASTQDKSTADELRAMRSIAPPRSQEDE